jgi:hypothetical protein
MALPVKVASGFGVLESMKSQTPSTKLQTNLKFQYPMTETGLEFGIFSHFSRLPQEGKDH